MCRAVGWVAGLNSLRSNNAARAMVLLEGVRSMCCRRTNHVQVHVSGSLLFMSQKLASFGSSIPETFDNPCRNQFVRATKLLACSAFVLSQCPSPRGRRVITIVPGVLETYGPSSTVKALDSCIMTIDVHGLEGGGCNSGVSRPGRQNLSQANGRPNAQSSYGDNQDLQIKKQ